MNINIIKKKSTTELSNCGIKTAELDTLILLEKVLKKDRANILIHDLEPMTNAEYARFRRLIRRRKKGEPIAYITGHKEFCGYDFFVNKNVLIPRPETELLVEKAIEFIKSHCDESAKKQSRLPRLALCAMARNDNEKSLSIIDIGTGSGCIIISLCKILLSNKLKSYKLIPSFFASDISKKALYVAHKNARLHKVNGDIRFFHSDLFSNKRMPKKYDLIISNLPYVAGTTSNLKSQISKIRRGIYYEPENAIFAPNNGTRIIKRLLDQAKNRINKNGLVLIEVDPRNAKELKKYAKKIFFQAKIELIKDLANLDRVIKILN